MDDPFGPIQGISEKAPIRARERAFLEFADRTQTQNSNFSGFLESALRGVATAEADATDKIQGLVNGKNPEIHEIMAAMGKSEIAFSMLLEVRNKLVDAWREVSHLSL